MTDQFLTNYLVRLSTKIRRVDRWGGGGGQSPHPYENIWGANIGGGGGRAPTHMKIFGGQTYRFASPSYPIISTTWKPKSKYAMQE